MLEELYESMYHLRTVIRRYSTVEVNDVTDEVEARY